MKQDCITVHFNVKLIFGLIRFSNLCWLYYSLSIIWKKGIISSLSPRQFRPVYYSFNSRQRSAKNPSCCQSVVLGMSFPRPVIGQSQNSPGFSNLIGWKLSCFHFLTCHAKKLDKNFDSLTRGKCTSVKIKIVNLI